MHGCILKRFLAQHGATELSHPQYSSDLSSPDFFLFPKLKVAQKERRFTDITYIQTAVTREWKVVPVEFSRAFDYLYRRCQRCIVYDGDYFEGL
ncbi:hypothetical protein AVEN_180548-1 [Araneus ventricosus]|uniref:Histone-lysine N-methyltransferase SETMAR n=1 Tax=Araneus ventricosus TaxID=182803 RepID=A0A4Y2FL17_ARAVE|nr:hypothetical protein AVEN_180548-1 [Araneus ventricosus]